MTKLKPCPFCGGKAICMNAGSGVYYIRCKCCGSITQTSLGKQLATKAWNRRDGE